MIDSFSKYAWAIPIKTKHGVNVYDGVKKILLVRRPQKMQMDRGTEFYNKVFLKMLKDYGIKWYSTNSEIKAGIVERFNRTLKLEWNDCLHFKGIIDILINFKTWLHHTITLCIEVLE